MLTATKMMTASGGYEPQAVKFDGSNDYLTRGADLTGIADSKSGIFSCWFRADGVVAHTQHKLISNYNGTNTGADIQINGSGQLAITMYSSAPATILAITSSVLVPAPNTSSAGTAKWFHLLASWDLNATTSTIYINDVADQTVTTRTNATIDYAKSTPNWGVCGLPTGSAKLNGAISELYFAPGQYLDFSVESNRRRFIDSSGYPVALGDDGSLPTGTQPVVYLKGDYSSFGVNSGTGGNFTVNGALEKASTTPATLPAYNAVDFDGSADYLSKASELTGLVDGKTGIISAWVRRDGGTGGTVIGNGSSQFSVYVDSGGNINVLGRNAAATIIARGYSTNAPITSHKWTHVLAAWNLAATTFQIYVDGTVATTLTATNDTIDYATGTGLWRVGDAVDGTNKLNGAISELYFAPNQYLDLSVQANREKFILNGAPVSLGTDGSLPTGVAPAIYLPNRATLVGTNAGTGGNFTINGAPKDANSTPVYYYAEPVKFDGTNDYLTRGGDLTGIADGTSGTVSCWIFSGGADSKILCNALYRFRFERAASKFRVYAENSSGGVVLNMLTSATYTATDRWYHVIASWNASNAVLYVDNVSAASATPSGGTIDYTDTNWGVGAGPDAGYKFNGSIADLWFNTTYLDLSNSANRAKFIDQTTLRPVSLGAKGELPTGSQPLLYLGRDYSNFQTNIGSGGNFTVTGALERATTSPSDVRS